MWYKKDYNRKNAGLHFFKQKLLKYQLLRVNLIGTVTGTLTALFLCFPGFHFGMDLITLTASLSIPGVTPFLTFTSEMLPFLLTIKYT